MEEHGKAHDMALYQRLIQCVACGTETFIRCEPVYDGFRKTGDRFFCAGCGHEYPDGDSVPYLEEDAAPVVFTEADRTAPATGLLTGDPVRNCRRCRHYVVNPFVQRCGLRHIEVQATDHCPDFDPKPADDPAGEDSLTRRLRTLPDA